MPQDELWSWRKFFSGFFVGKNYAKATVLGFCQTVILIIVFSLIFSARSIINKNRGTIIQSDSHAKTESKTWSLFNIFKVG